MADLTPQIERLLGNLSRARHPAGQAPAQLETPPPVLCAGDPGFAEAVARLVAMPLDQYAREGTPLGIRVRWCREPLWFVPIELDAELLGRRGVCRGQVWTARELIALMVLPDQTSDIVQTLTLVKRAVDGGIVEVRRR